MKKLQVLLIVLSAAVIFITACNKGDEVKLDFDLTVPDNWAAFVYANEGYIYDARRIAENENDSILEGLVIFKTKANGGTLDLYYSNLKQQIMNSVAWDSLLYESDTVINGTDFKKMISEETQTIINSQLDTFYLSSITDRYAFFENDYGYNMVFFSIDTTYYSKNKAIFDEIISTFHFKN